MKTKVLLLQTSIHKYRVSILNRLAEEYDLSVAYSYKDDSPVDVKYKRIRIKERRLGPFCFHKIRKLCKQFDVVIYLPGLHRINFWLVPILPHHYKTISFSIGMRASYSRKLDVSRTHTFLDKLFEYSQFKADAVLVYFKEVLSFWNLKDVVLKKCFQTRNTTDVIDCDDIEVKKDSILFVGTLYEEKRVDFLINSYNEAINRFQGEDFPNLEIIGKGDQLEELKALVKSLGLENKVIFRGAIYDENLLMNYFLRSLVSISPNQAGLSVPKSMGYGVPFITTKDAITGGEIFHIRDRENGILMESLTELPQLLEDVALNPDKYIEMGIRAKRYYQEEANVDTMVKGFSDAIKYALEYE